MKIRPLHDRILVEVFQRDVLELDAEIVVDKDNTTIIDGAGKTSTIEGRIKQQTGARGAHPADRGERGAPRRPPRTMTGRSCRSASRSWRAGSPSSRWGRRPRPR
jgi:hypothetical protein